MEFMLLVGIALFIILILFTLFANHMQSLRTEKEQRVAESMAFKLQKELNLAATVADGYQREIYVPPELDGIAYTLSYEYDCWHVPGGGVSATRVPCNDPTANFNASRLRISTGGFQPTVQIPKTVGELTFGINRIRKENGTVYLNN